MDNDFGTVGSSEKFGHRDTFFTLMPELQIKFDYAKCCNLGTKLLKNISRQIYPMYNEIFVILLINSLLVSAPEYINKLSIGLGQEGSTCPAGPQRLKYRDR